MRGRGIYIACCGREMHALIVILHAAPLPMPKDRFRFLKVAQKAAFAGARRPGHAPNRCACRAESSVVRAPVRARARAV